MDYKYKIISTYARQECKHITRKVISTLQKMKDNLQSGDDTPLKNIWDEVCVQMQIGKYFFWDAYLLTIRQTIDSEIYRINDFKKQVIWLDIDEGMDWSFENEYEVSIQYCEEDIINHILRNFVLLAANDWTNKRIEKYKEFYMSSD
jgi:hypothetical protein